VLVIGAILICLNYLLPNGLVGSCYDDVFYEGDPGDVCCLRTNWWRSRRKQGFHIAVSAEHSEISDERPADDDLILCHGLSDCDTLF